MGARLGSLDYWTSRLVIKSDGRFDEGKHRRANDGKFGSGGGSGGKVPTSSPVKSDGGDGSTHPAPRAAEQAASETAPTDDELREIEAAANPDGKTHPTKIREAYTKVKQAVSSAVVSFLAAPAHNTAKAINTLANELLLSPEEMSDIFFQKDQTGQTSGGDPISQAMGVSPVAAAKILSGAITKVLFWAKSMLNGDDQQKGLDDAATDQGEPTDDAVELLVGIVKAVRASLGVEGDEAADRDAIGRLLRPKRQGQPPTGEVKALHRVNFGSPDYWQAKLVGK